MNVYKQLAERETFIKSLFDKSQVGMNLCRMDGLWLESNDAFLQIIGYSREEAASGLTYWDLTPRKYDESEREQLKSLSETGKYGPYEKEFIRKDGVLIPVRLNGFIIERNGEEFIWSLIENMTERKELERELELERLKALHASRLASVGELAAGIAHEINNPLAIIDGYLNNLNQILASGNSTLLEKAICQMKSATERAVHIVRGLKRFSRENQQDEKVQMRLADVIQDSLEFCESLLESRGVELIVKDNARQMFLGNQLELSQVLMNLIKNAMDAVEGLSERVITLHAYDDSELRRVVLQVSDSGEGVSEDMIERIFDPFFTTKEVGKGTGLGLSISRSLVADHGGDLSYSLYEGKPCFSISLPQVEQL